MHYKYNQCAVFHLHIVTIVDDDVLTKHQMEILVYEIIRFYSHMNVYRCILSSESLSQVKYLFTVV